MDGKEADNNHHQYLQDGIISFNSHRGHPDKTFLALEEWVNRLADSVNS